MKVYRSGWIVKHTGISRKTLEDYERRGYIHPARSSQSSYREYTSEDIRTVWEIKQLILIGYTHKEIAAMLRTSGSLRYRQALRRKIHELEQKKDQLETILKRAKEIESTGKLPELPIADEDL